MMSLQYGVYLVCRVWRSRAEGISDLGPGVDVFGISGCGVLILTDVC